VSLPAEAIAHIAALVALAPQSERVTVDLEICIVVAPDGVSTPFELDTEAREMLLEGLDGIDLTLKLRDQIAAFRDRDRQLRPWIYL
jgi:3-isopropylmalate/(R)-2-methylmalate dehydratase small subunit